MKMVLLAATAAFGLAGTTADAQRIKVAPNKGYLAIVSQPSSGGSYVMAAGLHEINGKAAVCGLVWFDTKSNTTKQIEPEFTKQKRFAVDGKVLGVTTSAFIRYDTEAEAKKGMAGCSLSNRKWGDVKDPKSFKVLFSKRSHL
jgi:hypothetical protein